MLQCDKSLEWDTILNDSQKREWKLICRQVRSGEVVQIPRSMGARDDAYRIIAFVDASKSLYGTVVYMQNVSTLELSFVLAKNRIVSKSMEKQSIPCLELCALLLGAETTRDLVKQLTGDSLLAPVNIVETLIFTDSMVALNWVDGFTNKFNKNQNKLSVFVRNRLLKLKDICTRNPATFQFIAGAENPADVVSRAVSSKILSKSCFYSGPNFLREANIVPNVLKVEVPPPEHAQCTVCKVCTEDVKAEHLIPTDKYGSFEKLVRVHTYVLRFIRKLKERVCPRTYTVELRDENLFEIARKQIIKTDQSLYFPAAYSSLSNPSGRLKDLPNIVKQLGIFLDDDGIMRVRGKFETSKISCPVLLSKSSPLTELIIRSLHVKMGHAGKYSVLTELRREFYIPSLFSRVKMIISNCILCKRFNAKPIVLNQSPYREERINPSEIPFRDVYVDHFGIYNVKIGGSKQKVYLLLFSCMFTRAFNIQICCDMSVNSFLRAFQMHVHKYGMPSRVFSDSGTTIVAGGNVISDFLKDEACQVYLGSHGVKSLEFSHFCKGNSSLGSLVESGVKMCKKLIYGFMRNNCLTYFDFELLISDVNHLINKRPVAFKEAARETSTNEIPEVITPEMLIRGHALPSLNCIPSLEPVPDENDPDYAPNGSDVNDRFKRIRKVRDRMLTLYRDEFLSNLMLQSTDLKNRFKPVTHASIAPGDVVLLKEKFVKAVNFPLAVVLQVTKNGIGEVTSAKIKRGDNGEIVNRHSTVLIPLLSREYSESTADQSVVETLSECSDCESKPKRKAAKRAAKLIKQQI